MISKHRNKTTSPNFHLESVHKTNFFKINIKATHTQKFTMQNLFQLATHTQKTKFIVYKIIFIHTTGYDFLEFTVLCLFYFSLTNFRNHPSNKVRRGLKIRPRPHKNVFLSKQSIYPINQLITTL